MFVQTGAPEKKAAFQLRVEERFTSVWIWTQIQITNPAASGETRVPVMKGWGGKNTAHTHSSFLPSLITETDNEALLLSFQLHP